MEVKIELEEHLQIINAASGGLTAYDAPFPSQEYAAGAGKLAIAKYKCAVGLKSAPSQIVSTAVNQLFQLRKTLAASANLQGAKIVAAGLHPFSSWLSQELNAESEIRSGEIDAYQDISRSELTFGLTLHIHLPENISRTQVMNHVRGRLPLLLALTASSPFHDERDSGLQSWRHSLCRYPRSGVPELWSCDEAYIEYLDLLKETGALDEHSGLWEDIRFNPERSTVEVTICDAVASLDRVWLVATLLHLEIMEHLKSEAFGNDIPLPRSVIEENKWRVRRHGLSAELIANLDGDTEPVLSAFASWVERLRGIAQDQNCFERLDAAMCQAIREGTSSDQQRQSYKLYGSFMAVLQELELQTLTSCSYLSAIA